MQKIVTLPEIGEVILQKRKGSRSIRLTVGHDGRLKVSMPTWSPYHVGEAFVRSKTTWIKKHQATRRQHIFEGNERIGKAHRLKFIGEQRSNIISRVTPTEIIIKMPLHHSPPDQPVQAVIRKAAVRALKQEAKALLPRRLAALAAENGFSYRGVAIKQLKSRWGSCSSAQDIALNCFLMQLPWELIDYVLLHELVHTRIMAHGPKFWDELSHYVNNLAAKRKVIRNHQPQLVPQE